MGEDTPVSHGAFRWLRRASQLLLAGIAAYGVVTGNTGLLVNACVSLLVTFVPELVEREYDASIAPPVALWIAVAALLHAAGFLGFYRTVPWYDQLAHGVSAALVAGVGYAVSSGLDSSSRHVSFPPEFRAVFVLVFTLAFGVLWEIAEFGAGGLAQFLGAKKVLVQYGMDDIVYDLVFDAAGALVVALGGTRYFRGLAVTLAGRLGVFRDRS